MIPNMRGTVLSFSKDRTIRRKTNSNQIDPNTLRPREDTQNVTVKAMVTIINFDQVQKDKVDTTLRYIEIYSTSELRNDDLTEYQGVNYKFFAAKNFSEFGYYQAQAEEVKAQ